MSYQKLADLALKLGEKTKEGLVAWEDTAERGTYQTEINRNSVQIAAVEPDNYFGGGNDADYEISIFDTIGNKVESFRSEDINTFLPGNIHAHTLLEEMYQTARRRALGTEQVLDSILDALDDDSIPF